MAPLKPNGHSILPDRSHELPQSLMRLTLIVVIVEIRLTRKSRLSHEVPALAAGVFTRRAGGYMYYVWFSVLEWRFSFSDGMRRIKTSGRMK